MSLKKTLAGAMPFAHLLSNGSRAARAEENERDQREGESDDDYAKRMEELDEKERAEEERKEDEARRAEEERKEEEARRAAAEDGDDGDDESDDAKKAARATERARCARIIAHGINIGAASQAGVFAFDTKMSSKAAIAALDAAKVAGAGARRSSLDERMSRSQTPNPGAGGAGAAAPSMAQQIVMANKKRLGEQ
jgi:cobalamin biosynthesis protein CobT